MTAGAPEGNTEERLMSLGLEAHHRVLVVDDTPAIHEDIRRLLLSHDADEALRGAEAELFGEDPAAETPGSTLEIDSAMQGQEALERVLQACDAGRPYSLALVDVRMPPGWDGIETIGRLWERDPRIEMVICTAYSDKSWADIVEELGVTDKLLILKKPFDAIEVQQIARALTTKWAMQRQLEDRLADLNSMVAERTRSLGEANEALQAEMERREQMEVELRHAQKLEAVGQLASGIAHEINTPIQYVGDNVAFLREAFDTLSGLIADWRSRCESSLDPAALCAELDAAAERADLAYLLQDAPRAFEQTLDGVERVATIVRAMKDFGHPDQREQAPLDLNGKVQSTLIVARSEYKDVAEVDVVLGDLPDVTCHPGDIGQVLLNLIVNAAHAIEDKGDGMGVIRIRSDVDGDDAVITVADTGAGMPPEVAERIFEPFYTTKGVGRGTGQGLSIALSCVNEKHGGSLSFETEEGVGTTFTIRLPIAGRRSEVAVA